MKKNNKGFSLVELLVAVAILAIISIPLVRSFVVSATVQAKSRKLGDATLTAQNIAEAVKTSDVNGLSAAFRNNLGVTGVSVNPYQADGVTAFTGKLEEAPVVEYHLTGIAGTAMTADVTLDAAGFSEINGRPTVDYTEMDASFAQSRVTMEDPDQMAYSAYRTHVAADASALLSLINRRITILSRIDDTDGKMYVTVTYNYSFTYSYTEYDLETNTYTSRTAVFPHTESFNLFPQGRSVSATDYPTVYVMYYPLYSGMARFGGAAAVDSILLDNQEDTIPYDLYLAKQKDPDLDDGAIGSAEVLYAGQVIEQTTALRNRPVVKVHTNVNLNLVDGSKLTSTKYLLYTGAYRQYTLSFDNDASMLVSNRPTKRMYDVDIVIMDSAGDPITSLQAETLN